jgi:hypothetical protein
MSLAECRLRSTGAHHNGAPTSRTKWARPALSVTLRRCVILVRPAAATRVPHRRDAPAHRTSHTPLRLGRVGFAPAPSTACAPRELAEPAGTLPSFSSCHKRNAVGPNDSKLMPPRHKFKLRPRFVLDYMSLLIILRLWRLLVNATGSMPCPAAGTAIGAFASRWHAEVWPRARSRRGADCPGCVALRRAVVRPRLCGV